MFIITLILTGFAIFFAYTILKNKKVIDFAGESPLDILKVRFAKGEISQKEYDEIKTRLK